MEAAAPQVDWEQQEFNEKFKFIKCVFDFFLWEKAWNDNHYPYHSENDFSRGKKQQFYHIFTHRYTIDHSVTHLGNGYGVPHDF